MNNDELIARSEAALEGVTEGPWKLRLYQSGTVQVMIREWADGSPDTRQGGSTYGYHSAYMSMHNIGTRDDAETDNEKYRNGKFIAESRDLVPALIAALKASEARGRELEADLARAVDAMTDVSDRSMKTYRARNGRDCTIEASDGEACEIVHSDAMFGLRAALKALKGGAE